MGRGLCCVLLLCVVIRVSLFGSCVFSFMRRCLNTPTSLPTKLIRALNSPAHSYEYN